MNDTLATLSREDQRAYKQQYKKLRGEMIQSMSTASAAKSGGYVPLDKPRPVKERSASAKVPGTNITYDDGVVTGGAGIASRRHPARHRGSDSPSG